MLYLCTFLCLVLCRETRRLLERLVYVPTQDFPVTVVQVASWYLLRHLNAKNDQELMNVSIQPPHTCSNTRLNGFCDDILCTTHLKCLLPPVTHMETSNTYWNKLVILKTPLLVYSNSEHNLLFFRSFCNMLKWMEMIDCWSFIHCWSLLHPECYLQCSNMKSCSLAVLKSNQSWHYGSAITSMTFIGFSWFFGFTLYSVYEIKYHECY